MTWPFEAKYQRHYKEAGKEKVCKAEKRRNLMVVIAAVALAAFLICFHGVCLPHDTNAAVRVIRYL